MVEIHKQRRDAGLRRVRQLNRWLSVSALALTGIVSEVAAKSFPGKTRKASATSAKAARSGQPDTASKHESKAHATSSRLRPPAQAPTTTSTTTTRTTTTPASTTTTQEAQAAVETQRTASETHVETQAAPETAPSTPTERVESQAAAPERTEPETSAPSVSGGS